MKTVKNHFGLVGLVMLSPLGWTALMVFSFFVFEPRAEASSELIVLGDTQNYTTQPPPNALGAQTNWIVQNLNSENISFVTQVGDITNWGSNEAYMQWADTEMKILDGPGPNGIVPYSVTAGNHDLYYGPSAPANFVKYFGQSRYANYSWFGGCSPDQLNNYQIFSMNGTNYLHLNLRYHGPSTFLPDPDPAQIAWAQGVLDAHPNMPTIVSTHEYMNIDAPGRDAAGDYLWNNLISSNSQIFMVLCGHYWPEQHQVSTNQAGNKVIEIQADFQTYPNGGDGWLQKVIFDPDAGQIRVKTFSPTLNTYSTTNIDEFDFSVNFGARVTVNGEISPIRNWCGGAASGKWNSAANWSLAPVDGDMLTFSGTAQQNIYNDSNLPSVGLVTFNNGGFTLTGNSLKLNAGIVSSGCNTWGIDTTLTANQTINSKSGVLTVSGSIDTNGNTLTMNCWGNTLVTNSIYGNGGLIKTGTGTLSLTAANYYTGPTAVSGGKLILSNYSLSPVIVAGGASLTASGTIDNSVTLADGGLLEISSATSGSLNVQSLTFMKSGILNLTPNMVSPDSGGVNVSTFNGLAASGLANSVAINIGGGALHVGMYRLISYAGDIQGTGFAAFRLGTLPSGMTATLFNDSAFDEIDLVVANGIFSPSVWKGTGDSMYWSNLANWDVAPSDGNSLTFTGTSQQTTINDTALTNVSRINFNNGGFYVLGNPLDLLSGINNSGDNNWGIDTRLIVNQTFQVNSGTLTVSGSLSGPGMLTKTGNGILKLANANSFSGGLSINSGTVLVSSPNALGTGDISIAAGKLIFDLGGGYTTVFSNNLRLPVVGTPEFTMNNPSAPTTVRLTGKITGGAAGQTYTFADSGMDSNHNNFLILDNAANDFCGNIQLLRGSLGITSNGALGNPNNAIISNVGGGNGGLVFCADNVSIASTHSLQLQGAEAINVQNYSATIAGPVTGPGGLTKNGGGSLTLLGTNTYSGATMVSAGHLIVNGLLASSSVTVAGGATLGGSGTIAHPATILNSGILEAGGSLDTSSLTISALTFSGQATLNLSPNINSPTTNAIVVNSLNGLTVGDAYNSIFINILGLANIGTYHLIDYQGDIQGAGFNAFMLGSLPPGMTASLINNLTDRSIDLSVTHGAITTSVWTGSGWDNKWSTTSNWDYLPSNGSSIVFPQAESGALMNNHLLSDIRTVTFSTGGYTIAGDPVTLHGGIVNNGDNTWALNSVLYADQTIQVNSGTLTLSGTISGNHSLTKSGQGTLILENFQLTGNITVDTGTLEVDSLINSPQVTVHGILIADSIVADTLTISGPQSFSSSVPEPATLALLGWAIPCLLAFRLSRRRSFSRSY